MNASSEKAQEWSNPFSIRRVNDGCDHCRSGCFNRRRETSLRADIIDSSTHAVFFNAFVTSKILDATLGASPTLRCSKSITGMASFAHWRPSLSDARRSQSLLGSIHSTATQSRRTLEQHPRITAIERTSMSTRFPFRQTETFFSCARPGNWILHFAGSESCNMAKVTGSRRRSLFSSFSTPRSFVRANSARSPSTVFSVRLARRNIAVNGRAIDNASMKQTPLSFTPTTWSTIMRRYPLDRTRSRTPFGFSGRMNHRPSSTTAF